MRLVAEILGHRIELTIDHPDHTAGEREGAADTLVDRADPWTPTLGFGPNPRHQEET